ncbi:MAG: hypothetical protein EAZ55_11085 [Cytophagales bacterium]|nr:MAG: hypothetical protein EAZ55_11085 [Cytophagales bacterium]
MCQYLLKFTSWSILLLFLRIVSPAQTIHWQAEEQKLLHLHKKKQEAFVHQTDSLAYYSTLFSQTFSQLIRNHSESFAYPFDSLTNYIACHVNISPDKKLKIYSWDTYLGGTMHFFHNLYQYQWQDSLYCFMQPEEGVPDGFYTQVQTLETPQQTYYLATYNAIYSNREISQKIRLLTLGDSLRWQHPLIEIGQTRTHEIQLHYDFYTLPQSLLYPIRLLMYNEKTKVLYVPVIEDNGTFTTKCQMYEFKNGYFKYTKTIKNPYL